MNKSKIVTKLTISGITLLVLGGTTINTNASSKYYKDTQYNNAKIVKTTKYHKTRYTVKKSNKPVRIYRTHNLKSFSKSKNINVFYSGVSKTVKKDNGKKAVFRYVKSSTGKTAGWVWRGNMNPVKKTNKTISTTKATSHKSSSKKGTSHKGSSNTGKTTINTPKKSGSLGHQSESNTKSNLTQNVSNTNFNGFKNVKTLRDTINKLGNIINTNPHAWDHTNTKDPKSALDLAESVYTENKSFYLYTLTDKSSLHMLSQKDITTSLNQLDNMINKAK